MNDERRAAVIMREVSPSMRGRMWLELQRSEPLRAAATEEELAKLLSTCCKRRKKDDCRMRFGWRRRNRQRVIYHSELAYTVASRARIEPDDTIDRLDEQRCLRDQLRHRIETLWPVARSATLLRLRGLTQREIAAITGGTKDSVAQALMAARRQLRKSMAGGD